MCKTLDNTLVDYVEREIIPLYDGFDAGHGRDHVQSVILEALRLSEFYPVRTDIIYTAAAYHDTGLSVDRKTHHLESGRIIRNDTGLNQWFSRDDIELIAQAAEDHRASSDHEPRSIYGRIVAEADRHIIPESIILRTVQYGLNHYPELDNMMREVILNCGFRNHITLRDWHAFVRLFMTKTASEHCLRRLIIQKRLRIKVRIKPFCHQSYRLDLVLYRWRAGRTDYISDHSLIGP